MPDDRRVLDGADRMVVDGSNVLHALARPGGAPPAALIGRLRAVVPAGVVVTVVLDGSPGHGLVARHVASGVEVRYSGRQTADELIVHLLETGGLAWAAGTVVVTDDIGLSNTVRRAGGRVARSSFLLRQLDRQRLVAPATGRPVAPAPPESGEGSGRTGRGGESGDDEGPRWSPGRGATKKRGNPKRGHP